MLHNPALSTYLKCITKMFETVSSYETLVVRLDNTVQDFTQLLTQTWQKKQFSIEIDFNEWQKSLCTMWFSYGRSMYAHLHHANSRIE